MPSSAVRDIHYDPESETLWVTFVPTAKRYAYRPVPLEVYEAFIHAPSKGLFFNRLIRDQYDLQRWWESRSHDQPTGRRVTYPLAGRDTRLKIR